MPRADGALNLLFTGLPKGAAAAKTPISTTAGDLPAKPASCKAMCLR